MNSRDRDYFMLRSKQEERAARSSPSRAARSRHEELEWLYRVRLQYIDRGLGNEEPESAVATLVPKIVAAA
jgi:hypothetical protein